MPKRGDCFCIKHECVFNATKCLSPAAWTAVFITVSIFLLIILSVSLNLSVPSASSDPGIWKPISGVLGWIYFSVWSVSFYPQVIENCVRQSVVGMSFDYQVLNLVGYSCYVAFAASFRFNQDIQQQYMQVHDGRENVVEIQDVCFAVHSTILTIVTCVQIFFYEKGDQTVSWFTRIFVIVFVLLSFMFGLTCFVDNDSYRDDAGFFIWINFLYYLSIVKLIISIVKYVPQVYLNFRRKSTVGWNIWNVLLDFTGGVLSLAQIFIDAGTTDNWSAIAGDPVKFGLGFLSMFFDVIFMVQHYCMYPRSGMLCGRRIRVPTFDTDSSLSSSDEEDERMMPLVNDE